MKHTMEISEYNGRFQWVTMIATTDDGDYALVFSIMLDNRRVEKMDFRGLEYEDVTKELRFHMAWPHENPDHERCIYVKGGRCRGRDRFYDLEKQLVSELSWSGLDGTWEWLDKYLVRMISEEVE